MLFWQRFYFIPIDPQRETLEGVKIWGFDIQTGIEVLTNFFATQTDEAVCEEPKLFKPKLQLGQKQNLLLFGTGRRKR